MSLNTRIKEARLKSGLTQEQLGTYIGVAKTTVAGYEKNREPDAATIGLIMEALKVDANYLFQDEMKEISDANFSIPELKTIQKYRRLDEHGKHMVDTVMDVELDRIENGVNSTSENGANDIIYINFAQNTASAGGGNTLFGDLDDEPLALVANSITRKADFLVKVSGDSMLPLYSDGDTVLVSKEPVDIGDIGLFVIDGSGYIKKKGNQELISLNPDYKNIQINEFDTVYCMGKVVGKLEDEWKR